MSNIKAVPVIVKKIMTKVKVFVTDRGTDRRMRFNVPDVLLRKA